MDFIERWFGISPDNGSGATELLWLLLVIIVLTVYFRLRKAKAPDHPDKDG